MRKRESKNGKSGCLWLKARVWQIVNPVTHVWGFSGRRFLPAFKSKFFFRNFFVYFHSEKWLFFEAIRYLYFGIHLHLSVQTISLIHLVQAPMVIASKAPVPRGSEQVNAECFFTLEMIIIKFDCCFHTLFWYKNTSLI